LIFNQAYLSFADGNWSPWSSWSNPTEEHTETRNRSCDNPPPDNGELCIPGPNGTTAWVNGIYVETETRPSPYWSEWSPYSDCHLDVCPHYKIK